VLRAERRGKEVHYSVRAQELARRLREIADAIERCCPTPAIPSRRKPNANQRPQGCQGRTPTMSNDTIRKSVSEDYARAVQSPGQGCCSGPVQKGVAAKLAGYSDEELAALRPTRW